MLVAYDCVLMNDDYVLSRLLLVFRSRAYLFWISLCSFIPSFIRMLTQLRNLPQDLVSHQKQSSICTCILPAAFLETMMASVCTPLSPTKVTTISSKCGLQAFQSNKFIQAANGSA